jgi:hypothetical protein
MIRTRRTAAVLAALVAALLVISGCGSGSGGSKPKGLDDLLGYVPANSPLVVSANVDPGSDQWKNVDKILAKFPISGQIKGQLKQQFAKEHLNYDKDIKPLLGGDALFAFPDARELATSNGGSTPVIGAWSTGDGGKLKDLLARDGSNRAVGKSHGATIYTSGDEDWFAIDGNNAIAATSRPLLEAALARHDGSDHLTIDNFNKAFKGLPSDPLARFYINPKALLGAIPNAGAFSSLIGSGGPQGATLNVKSNKVEFDSNQAQGSGANAAVAGGDESPGVVRAKDELGIGWRNLAQTVKFYENTVKTIAPDEYGKFATGKAAINAGLGIDIDRDVVDQLSGNTYAAIGFGGWAVRSDVKDPVAMKATLAKIAKGAKRFDVDLKPVGDLYQLTDGGTTIFVGVLGKSLVFASDGAHAAQIVSEPVQQVPGAKGAIAINGDGKALADAGIQKYGQGMQAQFGGLFTGPLGAINGWFGASLSHLEVNFK